MMCCTKKWVGGLAALAALVLGLTVFSATDGGNWALGTAKVQWQKMWAWTQKQVTPEDEIARIANEVKDLDQDIDVYYDRIITQQRVVAKSADGLKKDREVVDEQWKVIKVLQVAVEKAKTDDKSFVTFEGKTSELSVARKELTQRWEKFKSAKATVESREKQLDVQKETLAALNDTYNAMRKAKDDYGVKLEQLNTQVASIRAAQAQNQLQAGGDEWTNRLSRVQASMDQISDKLEAMNARVSEQSKKFTGRDVTGAADTVKNDKTEQEIADFEANLNKLTSDK
jgi:chromosome segregation ATPase